MYLLFATEADFALINSIVGRSCRQARVRCGSRLCHVSLCLRRDRDRSLLYGRRLSVHPLGSLRLGRNITPRLGLDVVIGTQRLSVLLVAPTVARDSGMLFSVSGSTTLQMIIFAFP